MNAPSIQLKPKSQRSYIYLVSKIAAAFLNLLSISLFTRILDVQLYGNYLLYSSYVTLICSLLFWWHRLSVYRYYHKYEKYSNSYLKTSIYLYVAIIIILFISGSIIYISPLSHSIKLLVGVCIVGAVLKSNFDLNQHLLNISCQDSVFGINVIIRSLAFIVAGVIFISYFNLKESGLIAAFILSFLLASLYSTYTIYKGCLQGDFRRDIAHKFISYGFPMIGLFIFDYIITFFDRLSLAYFMGSSTVGMYGANFDLIKQILLFLMIIQSFILYPQINKAYETGDNKQLNKLLTFNLNIFLTVFIPLSVMVIYFNQFISEIFIGDKFTEYSPQLIPLFAVMFFIWGTKIYHFDYYFQLKEKTHYPMLILGLGSMLNIGFNILLIPKYGILGAAYATIIVYFVIFILSVMISKKLIKIDFKLSILIKVVIFLSLSIAAVNLPLISELNAIFKIMIFLAAYSLLTLKYNFKELKPHLKSIYN